MNKMPIVLLALLAVLNDVSLAQGETLLYGKVSAEANVEKVRTETLNDIHRFLTSGQPEQKDPAHAFHLDAIARNLCVVQGHELTVLPDDSYVVTQGNQTYTYAPDGTLKQLAIETGADYPFKTYRYRYPGGMLESVLVESAMDEYYVFAPNGELYARGKGSECIANDPKYCLER